MPEVKCLPRINEADLRAWRNVVHAAGLQPDAIEREETILMAAVEMHRLWLTPEPLRATDDMAKWGSALQLVAGSRATPSHPLDFIGVARQFAFGEAERKNLLAGIATEFHGVGARVTSPEIEIAQLRREVAELRAAQQVKS